MKLETGNMFDILGHQGPKGMFLVTGNSYIRNDGELVMGRGAAKQAKVRFPKLPLILGQMISHLDFYGFAYVEHTHLGCLGVFQVKYNFMDPAEVPLIRRSAQALDKYATERPDWRFDLNFPGIGNGKLQVDEVIDLITPLPDNIHVWSWTKLNWSTK